MSSNYLYCVLLQQSFFVTFLVELSTFEALLGGDNSYPLWHNVVLILLMKFAVSWFPGVVATDAAAGDAFCCFQARHSTICFYGWVMLLLVMR